MTAIESAVLTIVPLEEKKQKKGKKAPSPQHPVEIPLSNVEKANLVPEF